ncbi:MAG: protein kinase, partial [Gemmatimonadaceae bacterium]
MDQLEQLKAALADRYIIERELGGGGMSRVFMARETGLGRAVVIKVLPEETGAAVSIDRFKREIQVAAQLQQANIVPLLAAGQANGLPYYVMPYVEGESLRARLVRDGELPIADAVGILREVARALAYAHDHGIVHRDIKPDNVLLSGGSAVVTDFGVAKALNASVTNEMPPNGPGGAGLTSMGVALGTPAYMSPEQASADPSVDHRADIYAFGAMAYELLTGQPPFAGRTPAAMLAAHVTEQPESIDRRRRSVPPPLASLIMKCLEKRPSDRPQSAAETLRGLDAVATPSGTLPIGAPPANAPSRSLVIGALAVLVLSAIATVIVTQGRRSQASGSTIQSVAVLPFENVGGDTATQYFSDGMRDELANALGKVPSLAVASRTSSYAFRGKGDVSLQDIGRRLHVDAVLEGTVRRSGDQLVVSAQLTRVASGMGLWSDRYQRRMTDIFAVQEELAQAISQALSSQLSGRQKAIPVSVASSRGTQNPAAYDLYLRGRYLWNARENLPTAIDLFKRAVQADPTYAQAYAGLASAYALLPFYIGTTTPDALKDVRAAAAKSLALDSTSAEPHAALGLALGQMFAWTEAEQEFERAIAIDSTYANAYHWYGFMLRGMGRTAEAIRRFERAIALDPLSLVFQQNYTAALVATDQLSGAKEVAARVAELAPNDRLTHRVAAFIAQYEQRWDAAAQELEQVRPNRAVLPELAYVYMKLGRRRTSDSIAADIAAATARGGLATDAAIAYGLMGDRDKAIFWLNRAI